MFFLKEVIKKKTLVLAEGMLHWAYLFALDVCLLSGKILSPSACFSQELSF